MISSVVNVPQMFYYGSAKAYGEINKSISYVCTPPRIGVLMFLTLCILEREEVVSTVAEGNFYIFHNV